MLLRYGDDGGIKKTTQDVKEATVTRFLNNTRSHSEAARVAASTSLKKCKKIIIIIII